MSLGRDYLGEYRLVRLIRAGQTCQVWEALSSHDNRRVALKVLQPDLRDSKEEINYLKHEFEVGGEFDHPNVIQIHGFLVDKQDPFLVMEFSSSKNMKLVMRLGYDQIAHLIPRMIAESAAGLGYVHEQGWVHRDVKPDNFLVGDDGDIKLIDFALAQRPPKGLGKLFAGRTKVQGTRSYMAPEQIRGKAVDPRADIYSFGCVIFELLAGRPPYTGATPEDLLNKHLRAGVPSLAASNQNVTSDFANLIASMMAKTPDERPESISNFLRVFHSIRLFRSTPKAPEKDNASK